MKKLEVRKLETLKPTLAAYSIYAGIALGSLRVTLAIGLFGGQTVS